MTGTCESCRHWERSPYDKFRGLGDCRLILGLGRVHTSAVRLARDAAGIRGAVGWR